jgi:hypothetical protein
VFQHCISWKRQFFFTAFKHILIIEDGDFMIYTWRVRQREF